MDQSKSSEEKATQIVLPRRKFTMEFWVGLFAVMGLACAGWLSVGLGGIDIGTGKYQIIAEFDNISGLKKGASVEIAGVQIGAVYDITLKDPMALVTLSLDKAVPIHDDDIASIRTKGIIGDRYVKISRGGSTEVIKPGGKMVETESVVDLEDVIGKIVHSLSGDDKKSETKE